jgi:hypothetical protein
VAVEVLVLGAAAFYTAMISRAASFLSGEVFARQVEGRMPGEAAWEASRRVLVVRRGGRVLEGDWSQARLRLTAPLRAPLPPKLRFDPPRPGRPGAGTARDWRLSEKLAVSGAPAWWVRGLLVDETFRERILGIPEGRRLDLLDGTLGLHRPADDPKGLPADADLLLALLDAAERGSVAAWCAQVGRPALRPTARGPQSLRLAGILDGVPVQLGWSARDPRDAGAVVLDVSIPRPVPGDFVVQERTVDPHAPRLGDLVLDRFVGARGAGLGQLTALLARDPVRGPLLDVLKGPGLARIEGPRIRVVVPGATPDPAVALLDSAVELARALSGAGG